MSVGTLVLLQGTEISRNEREVSEMVHEYEGSVDISSEVNEINKFCMGVGGSPDAVIDVAEKLVPVNIWNKYFSI